MPGWLELFRSGWPVPAAEPDQGGLGCARGLGHDQVVLPPGKGWAALWGGLHLKLAPAPGHRPRGPRLGCRKRPGRGLCPGALSPSGLSEVQSPCPVVDPGSDGPREIGACGTVHSPLPGLSCRQASRLVHLVASGRGPGHVAATFGVSLLPLRPSRGPAGHSHAGPGLIPGRSWTMWATGSR